MFSFLSYVNEPSLKWVNTRQDLVISLQKNPLKKKALMTVTKRFGMSNAQAAKIGGLSLRTYQRQKPVDDLSPQASESVVKLAEVYETGLHTFDGNEAALLQWLKKPIPSLGNQIPEDMLVSVMGADIVNEELLRIEHGVFS